MKLNWHSISTKLIIGGVMAAVIPIAIIGFYSVNKASNALGDLSKGQAVQISQNLASMTELVLAEEIKLAKQMAVEPLVLKAAAGILENGIDSSKSDVEALDSFFVKVYKQIGESYDLMFISDSQGNTLSDSAGGALRAKGINIADRDYFIKAKAGEINIGSAIKSRASGKPVSVVAVPLKNASGEFAGIFGAVLKLDFLSEKITSVKIGNTGYPFMIDRKGLVIAHPNKDFILKLDLTTLDGMKTITSKMLAGETGIEEYTYKGTDKISGFAPVPVAGWSIGVTQNVDEFQIASTSIRNSNIMIAVLAGVLTAIIVAFASRTIVRPINSAVAGLKDIAQGEGDLTMRLTSTSKDEIGQLTRWFNVFIEKLQGIIGDISNGVETLSSSSTELSAISEQMSQGIQDASDKSTTVSAAVEEMSANMNTVAAAMEQSATNTNMVATASEEMSSTIGEIAQNAEKARITSDEASSKASDASENMDQLGHAANSIGKVIETITDISEQVNLLALNATIEAARAGEAGKGFAVVANEIKELAKQTAEATQDIKAKIEGIQGTTSSTVGQINEITRVIKDVNSVVANIATAVEQQSAATKEIAGNVSQASKGIQDVNENVSQSSSVSSEISRDIAGVSVSMNEMSTSSNQVNLSAQELSQLSENLKRLVDQFKF